jgi:glycerate kinase
MLSTTIKERDMAALQTRLKETKKVTMRDVPDVSSTSTQSRASQTDPWTGAVQTSNEQADRAMHNQLQALEQKYETMVTQKNERIQQLLNEVNPRRDAC